MGGKYRMLLLFLVGYWLYIDGVNTVIKMAVFFGDISRMGWPGQFNLDFMGLLLLSGFWLAWRHHFSPAGLGLGFLGAVGGAPVLTAYLLVTSFTVDGDVGKLLLGETRANRQH